MPLYLLGTNPYSIPLLQLPVMTTSDVRFLSLHGNWQGSCGVAWRPSTEKSSDHGLSCPLKLTYLGSHLIRVRSVIARVKAYYCLIISHHSNNVKLSQGTSGDATALPWRKGCITRGSGTKEGLVTEERLREILRRFRLHSLWTPWSWGSKANSLGFCGHMLCWQLWRRT